MLDLSAQHPALAGVQQRFFDEALAPAVVRRAFAAFDASKYSAEELAWGCEAWQLRALDEYRSQVAFTELLGELTQLGFSFDALGTAVRVVRDEARHVELCRRLVKALGGSDVISGTPSWTMSDKSQPLLQRVMLTITGSLCVGETLSVRMIAGVRENTADPLAHGVMSCLLADESVHSLFGWKMLELLAPHMSEDDRALVNASLVDVLAAVEEIVAGSAPQEEMPLALAPKNPFGSLDARSRERIYRRCLSNEILPRFEKLGFAPRRAKKRTAKRANRRKPT